MFESIGEFIKGSSNALEGAGKFASKTAKSGMEVAKNNVKSSWENFSKTVESPESFANYLSENSKGHQSGLKHFKDMSNIQAQDAGALLASLQAQTQNM